jgi:maltose/moltooligosaccharide transporter
LNLHFGITGPVAGWATLITTGFGIVFGFAIGSLTDWLKPVRLLPYPLILSCVVSIWGFFYVHDPRTILILTALGGVINFVYSVIFGAYQVEVFPREKLGQFCSAQAVFYQVIVAILVGPLCGAFFDYTKTYRLSFVWIAFFQALAGLVYLKVYFQWKKRHGRTIVPHAG